MPRVSERFASEFLKGADLEPGQDVVAMITGWEERTLRPPGAPPADEIILHLQGAPKDLMVLNKSNALIIAGFAGDEIADWPGKAIALYASREKVAGRMQTCLRVRENPPPQAPPPTMAGKAQATIEERLGELNRSADELVDAMKRVSREAHGMVAGKPIAEWPRVRSVIDAITATFERWKSAGAAASAGAQTHKEIGEDEIPF